MVVYVVYYYSWYTRYTVILVVFWFTSGISGMFTVILMVYCGILSVYWGWYVWYNVILVVYWYTVILVVYLVYWIVVYTVHWMVVYVVYCSGQAARHPVLASNRIFIQGGTFLPPPGGSEWSSYTLQLIYSAAIQLVCLEAHCSALEVV